MNHYFALTIGPIIRTLSEARKTRELWGLSYLFSYLMREIVVQLLKENIFTEENILLPYREKHEAKPVGAGLYPDRLMVEVPADKVDGLGARVQVIIEKVITTLAEKSGQVSEVDALQKALQVYHIQLSLKDGENIVFKLNQYLDTAELQNKIAYPWSDKYSITDFSDRANGRVFLKEAYPKDKFPDLTNRERFRFTSIPQISTTDFQEPKGCANKQEEEEWREAYKNLVTTELWDTQIPQNSKYYKDGKQEEKFIKNLREHPLFKSHFRFRHKYFCIVHADGDSIGKILENIGTDPDKVRGFSEALFDFSQAAVQDITKYGGFPVYAGGDDLVFFAPVAYDNGSSMETIFNLIETIDATFTSRFLESGKVDFADSKPSISYGLSISYYKYPLQEAMETSRNLLFADAKNTKGKDAVAFKFLKHSGQWFGTVLKKSGRAYQDYFLKMLHDSDFEELFLHSIQYKLRANEVALCELLKEDNRTDRLVWFFANTLNEDKHEEKEKFLNLVREYFMESFENEEEDMKENDQDKRHQKKVHNALERVFSALRFIEIINKEA